MAINKDLQMNPHTNLLEKNEFDYVLQDVAEPNLYRIMFDYEHIPRIAFNMRHVPMAMPEKIWITDTTFRDGQQSREPYTTEQIVDIFDICTAWAGRTASSARASSSCIPRRTGTRCCAAWSAAMSTRRSPAGFAPRARTLRWCARSA